MNIIEMTVNAFKALTAYIADGGKLVKHDTRQKRLDICKSNECGQYLHISVCNECKCFLPVKTWLPLEKCPLDKWDVEEGYHKLDVSELKCGGCGQNS